MKNEKVVIEPFIKYNSKISSRLMSEADGLVFSIIAMHANNKTGIAYPSIQRICHLSGYDKTTVLKSIESLNMFKFLTVKQSKSPKGYIKNIYILPELSKDFIMISHKFILSPIEKDLKAFLIKIHPLLDTRVDGPRAKLCLFIYELCDLFGYRERTIKDRLNRLIALGIIEFDGMYVSRKRFNNNTNIFIFNLPAMHQEILKRKESKYVSTPIDDEKSEKIRALEEELAYEKSVNRHLLEEKGMKDIIKNYYKEE